MRRTELLQENRKMRFAEVYGGWRQKRLSQEEAASILGVCSRTFRRQICRYEENGLEGLNDKRLTQASHRRAPVDEVMSLGEQYRLRYRGWNVKHFYSWYSREGGKVSKTQLTQFARAMQQLGIEMIPAYSPEARGRSERMFQTHQDRLPKELAANNINTMEAANGYLRKVYMPAYNKEFKQKQLEEGSAFVPPQSAINMIDISKINYSIFDKPEIITALFYPRRETEAFSSSIPYVKSIMIPVEKEVYIGGRFYLAGASAANILFFHGNGEIAADYDDIGTLYKNMGMNFLAIDYRGYGVSTGKPTVTAMMRDCHVVFDFIKKWLAENAYVGPLIVMGRSLGSASALEVAYHYKESIDGLIIESGFAHVNPLLQLLGIHLKRIEDKEEGGINNADKIRSFDKPTLIIHAEYDRIIPYNQGEILYENCPSVIKKMLKIEDANHNNIFAYGIKSYMDSVKWLIDAVEKTTSGEYSRS